MSTMQILTLVTRTAIAASIPLSIIGIVCCIRMMIQDIRALPADAHQKEQQHTQERTLTPWQLSQILM